MVAAIAVRFIIGRRRFKRRGIGGLQHFNSYSNAVFTMFIEKLFMILSKMAIVAAIILFFLHLLK